MQRLPTDHEFVHTYNARVAPCAHNFIFGAAFRLDEVKTQAQTIHSNGKSPFRVSRVSLF